MHSCSPSPHTSRSKTGLKNWSKVALAPCSGPFLPSLWYRCTRSLRKFSEKHTRCLPSGVNPLTCRSGSLDATQDLEGNTSTHMVRIAFADAEGLHPMHSRLMSLRSIPPPDPLSSASRRLLPALFRSQKLTLFAGSSASPEAVPPDPEPPPLDVEARPCPRCSISLPPPPPPPPPAHRTCGWSCRQPVVSLDPSVLTPHARRRLAVDSLTPLCSPRLLPLLVAFCCDGCA